MMMEVMMVRSEEMPEPAKKRRLRPITPQIKWVRYLGAEFQHSSCDTEEAFSHGSDPLDGVLFLGLAVFKEDGAEGCQAVVRPNRGVMKCPNMGAESARQLS